MKKRPLLALGVALLAVLPYLNGLRNGFTFDDVPIVAENQRIRSLSGLGRALTTDWWGGAKMKSLLYRPLTMATFSLDYAAALRFETDLPPARLPERAAFPFHLQNLLWHGAATAALFLLVLELFASPALALTTAALFAVHPVHAEAVDGIVGRAELMSACFVFLTLIVASRVVRDDPPGAARPVLAGFFLLLALVSKETAIVIPAVPLLWLLPQTMSEKRSRIRRPSFRLLVVSLGAATLLYLSARAAVLGSVIGARGARLETVNVDNPIATAEGVGRLLTPARVFGHVLRLLLYPRTLSADYSYDQIPLVASLDGATLLCLLALCGLVAAGLLLRRRAPAASFGILFFLLTWALTSNFFIAIGTILGERLLYLPSAGACLAIASILVAMGRRLRVPRMASALTAGLVLLGATRTWARNPEWRDNLALFRSAAAASPRSCKAPQAYASELVTMRRFGEAVPWAERSLEIFPQYLEAHQVLNKAYRLLADGERDPARKKDLRARAKEHTRILIDHLAPGMDDGTALADAWNVLGALALDEGDLDGALEGYRKSVEAKRDYVPAVIGIGAVQAIRANLETDARRKDELEEAAVRQFEQAAFLDPGSGQALQNAALTLYSLASRAGDAAGRERLARRAGDHEARAFAAWRAAGDTDSIANLHGVRGNRLLGERRHPEALDEFREAIRLQPGTARGHLGMGSVLTAQAEEEMDPERKRSLVRDAIGSFERALELEPENPTAHFDLGVTYLRLERDPAKVVLHFRAYLRLVPDSPDTARMEQTIREMERSLERGGR